MCCNPKSNRKQHYQKREDCKAGRVTNQRLIVLVCFQHGVVLNEVGRNAQWQNGYTNRFGIVYVDYNNGYKRYLKASAKFLANLFGTWNKPGPSLLSAVSTPAPGPSASGLIRLNQAPQGAGAPALPPAGVAVRNPRPQAAQPMIGA
jgi:Glycosyl hydrolase family 1